MNVGRKSNDSSLIFSGYLHFGFLPFCLSAPDIILRAIDIVYILFQVFHFMSIMFVFLTIAVWPAGPEHHNSTVRRMQVAIM